MAGARGRSIDHVIEYDEHTYLYTCGVWVRLRQQVLQRGVRGHVMWIAAAGQMQTLELV
jgi:hypothetical protein